MCLIGKGNPNAPGPGRDGDAVRALWGGNICQELELRLRRLHDGDGLFGAAVNSFCSGVERDLIDVADDVSRGKRLPCLQIDSDQLAFCAPDEQMAVLMVDR